MKIEDVTKWQCGNGIAVAINPYGEFKSKSGVWLSKYIIFNKEANDPANQPSTSLTGVFTSDGVEVVEAWEGLYVDCWLPIVKDQIGDFCNHFTETRMTYNLIKKEVVSKIARCQGCGNVSICVCDTALPQPSQTVEEAADKWILVEDSEDMPMPPFEEKTQIFCENGEQYIGYFNGADNHGFVWFCDNNDYHYPTHWKYLTTPNETNVSEQSYSKEEVISIIERVKGAAYRCCSSDCDRDYIEAIDSQSFLKEGK